MNTALAGVLSAAVAGKSVAELCAFGDRCVLLRGWCLYTPVSRLAAVSSGLTPRPALRRPFSFASLITAQCATIFRSKKGVEKGAWRAVIPLTPLDYRHHPQSLNSSLFLRLAAVVAWAMYCWRAWRAGSVMLTWVV